MTEQTLWACHACQATNAPGLFFCAYCDTWRADRDPRHNGGVVTIYHASLVDRFRQIATEYDAALTDAHNAAIDRGKELKAKIKTIGELHGEFWKMLPAVVAEHDQARRELVELDQSLDDLRRRQRFISATLAAAGAVEPRWRPAGAVDRLDQLAAQATPAGVSECVVCGTPWPAGTSDDCPSGTGCSGYRWINTNRKDT